ncbi:5'-nucleotidase [Podospora fimiseda]|uniref:5'-nucleotidase n=1 Tax=Podospora fimiseda TaxID=252190 RepID=A0AAN7GUK0_9PEZI|nr:5'-nucleotidase [Podospora fimiseda]
MVGRFAALLRQAKQGLDPLKAETPGKPKGISPPIVVLSSKIFAPRPNTTAGDVTSLLQKFPIDVVCCVTDSAPGSTRAADPSPYSKPRLGSPNIVLSNYEIKQHGPYRICFFGMVGIDWDAKKAPSEILPVGWKEQIAREAQTNARILRNEHQCNFVIAVTNMRLVEDIIISKATAFGDNRIDFIFGGYDGHVLQRSQKDINSNPAVIMPALLNKPATANVPHSAWIETTPAQDVRIVKSGTEWESLSVVELCIKPARKGICSKVKKPCGPTLTPLRVNQMLRIERHPYFSQLTPANDILSLIDTINGPSLKNLTSRPLFISHSKLNGAERHIRHQETNLGNLITDAMKAYYDADMALYPSKSIRCDRILGHHVNYTVTGYDILDCFPFQNNIVMKLVSGKTLLSALENSFSNRHADGRFLQVSGLRIKATWQRPKGTRVISAKWTFPLLDGTQINEPIYPDRNYMVAMTEWMAEGWGGYSILRESQYLTKNTSAVGITDTDLMISAFAEWDKADQKWFLSEKNEQDVKEYFYGREEPLSMREYQLRNVRARLVKYLDEGRLPGVKPEVDGRIKLHREHRELDGEA